jgi:hypothetical protein
MRLAQEGRERVAVLDVGGRDQAFDRQAKVSTATAVCDP